MFVASFHFQWNVIAHFPRSTLLFDSYFDMLMCCFLSLHAGYHSRDEILYTHSSRSFSWILHIHPFCSNFRSAPRQRSSALYMAQHKLRPASRTQQPHHRIPSNVSPLFQNFQTSGRSVCRQHRPLANKYQLLLKWDPHHFNAEGSTAMVTPPFCQWRGPGNPKMLLLLGRLVLGPQRLPITQFQHHLLRHPTCNDIRQVIIHPYYPTSRKQHWEAHTGSAFITRWIF